MENIKDFMTIRYEVIDIYPGTPHKKGDVLTSEDLDIVTLSRYANIFKALKWWECRTVDEIFKIKFVKIIKKAGYYLVGDINQSIYGYSGSNCSHIESILEKRRKVEKMTLTTYFIPG